MPFILTADVEIGVCTIWVLCHLHYRGPPRHGYMALLWEYAMGVKQSMSIGSKNLSQCTFCVTEWYSKRMPLSSLYPLFFESACPLSCFYTWTKISHLASPFAFPYPANLQNRYILQEDSDLSPSVHNEFLLLSTPGLVLQWMSHVFTLLSISTLRDVEIIRTCPHAINFLRPKTTACPLSTFSKMMLENFMSSRRQVSVYGRGAISLF